MGTSKITEMSIPSIVFKSSSFVETPYFCDNSLRDILPMLGTSSFNWRAISKMDLLGTLLSWSKISSGISSTLCTTSPTVIVATIA